MNEDNSLSNHSAMDHSQSSNSLEEHGTPFFADITLDLALAHDIAETPEPMHKTLITGEGMTGSMMRPPPQDFPTMPSLSETAVSNSTTSLDAKTTPIRISMQQHQQPPPPSTATQTMLSFQQEQQQQPHSSAYSSSNPQDDSSLDRDMNRVTGNSHNIRKWGGGLSSRVRRSSRKWPKDVSWAMTFVIVVPITLLFPIWFAGNGNDSVWLATGTSPRLATLHTLLWGLAVAILLSRLLYRTAGGGDGDDTRHVASQVLLASAPISVSVFIMLIVAMKIFTPHAFWPYAVIPLWYLARDLYLFRRWKMTSTTPGGRQAFFQALTCMTLDILSRSLRRNPLWRMIVGVIVTQFLVICLWRMSLMAAIQSQSFIWILMAAFGGKWATGTVARLLSLVACGGISNWFAEQSSLVEEISQAQLKNRKVNMDSNTEDGQDKEMVEFSDLSNTNINNITSFDDMPEAYRSVDASAYKSVLQNQGAEDDNFEDEDDVDEETEYVDAAAPARRYTPSSQTQQQRKRVSRSTVKQFLTAGLSVNFGSVAKCGLLGGVAQFLWSQIRKIDHARAAFGSGNTMMQGMDIRAGPESGNVIAMSVEGCFNKSMLRINHQTRNFVRCHSDMAMSHVADYQLSYTRAAQEVALLLDEAGVEPILHDDISTHISACVGGSVSGLIILFTGAVLTHQRNRNSPHVPDSSIVIDMLIAFFFCYTLIFTVMEPLRASIKAVYVCFAQHPESLSQAFPLIYHRLTRMSQSNLQ